MLTTLSEKYNTNRSSQGSNATLGGDEQGKSAWMVPIHLSEASQVIAKLIFDGTNTSLMQHVSAFKSIALVEAI